MEVVEVVKHLKQEQEQQFGAFCAPGRRNVDGDV